MQTFRKRYLGDRAFYRMTLAVAVPIMIQNGITSFVSLLDNLMVGRLGTEPMSSVAIVNELLFVYNLCIFGGLGGAGIFTAQFYGQGDQEGVRSTFRYKLLLALGLTALAVGIFLGMGDRLISLFLTGDSEGGDLALTLSCGLEYLRVVLFGLPAFMLVQTYTSTLRECSETVMPMKAGIAAVLVNLMLNWVLIYGRLGFPALGVTGAALATVISRWVEFTVIAVWTHRHTARNPWAAGLYRTLHVPGRLVRRLIVKGSPLLVNEALWSGAEAMLGQCYSVLGLTVVAAMNISLTIGNLFSIVFLSMGSAVAIIVGQRLGAGRMEEAREVNARLIAFSVMCAAGTGLLMFLIAPLFPRLYNTTDAARMTAVQLIRVTALFMPLHAFLNACYFTLRSGGKTIITFIFDSVFSWVVSVPIAFVLSRYSDWSAPAILTAVNAAQLLKCVFGYRLVKKGVWLHNIVN